MGGHRPGLLDGVWRRVKGEDWTALPERTLFHIDGEQRLSLQPL